MRDRSHFLTAVLLAVGAVAVQLLLALSLAVQQARQGFVPRGRRRAREAPYSPNTRTIPQ